MAGRSCRRTASAQASMSALISASPVPARVVLTLAPHELPIHALRTNEALPIRHGISDFLKAPAASIRPAATVTAKPAHAPNVLFLRWPSLKRPGRFPPIPAVQSTHDRTGK